MPYAIGKTIEKQVTVEEVFATWVQDQFAHMGHRADMHILTRGPDRITYVAEAHVIGAPTQRHLEVHCSSDNFGLFIGYPGGRTKAHEYEYADPNCFEKLLADIEELLVDTGTPGWPYKS